MEKTQANRMDDRSLEIFLARANRYAQQQPNLARDILFLMLVASQLPAHANRSRICTENALRRFRK